MKRGKFIVIEGGEGSGKSSQLEALKEHFGNDAIFTREPGGAPYAEKIRDVILSEDAKNASGKTHFCLFWASRRDHLENTIIPALKEGKIVFCDRFDSSTFAYQIHAQEEADLEDLFFQIRELYLGEYKPDAYIYLDVDPEVGLARKAKAQKQDLNHFDNRKIEFHKKMMEGMKRFGEHVPMIFVDTNSDFGTVKKALIVEIEKII